MMAASRKYNEESKTYFEEILCRGFSGALNFIPYNPQANQQIAETNKRRKPQSIQCLETD